MKPPRKSKYEPRDYPLRVGRSRTGLGLFSESSIPKGECLIEYVGRLLSKEEEYSSRSKYLFDTGQNRVIDGQARTNKARYINHSCRPNCEIVTRKGRVFIFSRRNIKRGEELLYDYGEEYFDEFIKPHGCRCEKCQPQPAFLIDKRFLP